MHTAVIYFSMRLNIDKLIKASKDKKVEKRKVSELGADHLCRTKESGFNHKQYKNADVSYPLLITRDNVVIDGRHRLCKLFDNGVKTAKVIVMSDKEIFDCEIK
jgi:hypothetical protein